jgi:poly(3-hydroxybutyrate) depolymerase
MRSHIVPIVVLAFIAVPLVAQNDITVWAGSSHAGSTTESGAAGLPPLTPVELSVTWMVQALGCETTPDEATVSKTTTQTWSQCRDRVRAGFITLTGSGHSWPTGRSFDATSAIADFFFGDLGSPEATTTTTG